MNMFHLERDCKRNVEATLYAKMAICSVLNGQKVEKCLIPILFPIVSYEQEMRKSLMQRNRK